MANAWVHSVSSAKHWGGKPEDYLAIHEKMDCSKKVVASNLHRCLTHHHFWILEVMIPIFGYTIKIGDKDVCVKDICEQHIQEDFAGRFIPSAQDYLEHVPFEDWFQNGMGESPSSCKGLKCMTNKINRRVFKLGE